MKSNKNKFNINLDEDFKGYIYKQVSFIFMITLLFFVLFYFNFGLILASFMLWSFLVFSVLILYLDIKFMYKHHKIEMDIENLKYILRSYKK